MLMTYQAQKGMKSSDLSPGYGQEVNLLSSQRPLQSTPLHTHTPVLHQNEALQGSVAIDSAFSFLQMCTLMWRSWCGLHPPLIPGEHKGYVPCLAAFLGGRSREDAV